MDAKFKRIVSFLETLPVEKVLSSGEEALLLVGGTGTTPTTNEKCTNNGCVSGPDRTDNKCQNNGCTNNGC